MAVRPHVVAQVAVSVDGVTSGFAVDHARFYALATLWQEDVTLIGADTILAEEQALRSAARHAARPSGPLLAVVDSRARVREWESLRRLGHWSDVLALYADQTPARPLDSVIPELVAGYDRVDLAEALDLLGSRHHAKVVRVDSNGRLLAVLLELLAEALEHHGVVVVHTELPLPFAAQPRVLRGGVQRRPTQVEPDAAAVRVECLRLQPGQQPQGLCVPLEPADPLGQLVERPLTVVPVRRVAEIVGQAGCVHDVRIAAERAGQLATDLRDLEAVRQPVPDEVVAPGGGHLRLRREPAQRGAVQHPSTIASEGSTAWSLDRLRYPALRVMLVVPLMLLPHQDSE
jgi:2,5-diamino-6-(ribosylamino)-4(3H)-pyrimidinone 5'-phosphate reductase